MAREKPKYVIPKRKPKHPYGIERDYARILRAVARALAKVTRQHLSFINSHFRQDETESEYVLRLIREAYIATGATERALAQAARIAERIKGYSQAEFSTVLRSALKVNVFAVEPDLRRLVAEWTAENVRLIKTIPDQYFDQLQGIVSRGLQQGTLTEDMVDEIQDLYSVTSRRAQLIATDQVGKLNGLISQERQTAAGIEAYQWSTSHDERVRESHAEIDGFYFAWPGSNAAGTVINGKTVLPPRAKGVPGWEIRCRCVAIPVVPVDSPTIFRI